MKVGDKVRITGFPPSLPDNDMGTRKLFELCLGREFAVAGFEGKLLELHVGELVGEPSYMQTIWIEPEFVEVIEVLDWSRIRPPRGLTLAVTRRTGTSGIRPFCNWHRPFGTG